MLGQRMYAAIKHLNSQYIVCKKCIHFTVRPKVNYGPSNILK